MKSTFLCVLVAALAWPAAAEFHISSFTPGGEFTLSETFTNGVGTLLRATEVEGPYQPLRNIFTTANVARASLAVTGSVQFYRAQARDLSSGRTAFTNLTRAYGLLTTIAGNGTGFQDVNNWRADYEGAPAVHVALSGPHFAMADPAGCIYIADKDAHAIRKLLPDGRLFTVAGTNAPGDGPDGPGTACGLNQPNGLWVRHDGTVFIYDLSNRKVRRLDANGTVQTLFTIPGITYLGGRGLWVSDDETVAYFSALNVVKKWTPSDGVTDFSAGYAELGNLVMDPWGSLVVTDRGGHRVYRLDNQGQRTPIAGNGTTSGGGDGQLALATGLEEVRGVAFLPTGAYVLCTHRSSRVWYVDTAGFIHLLLHGHRDDYHAGDGTWFYNPGERRISKCRAITVDHAGNLLITENDFGYVRKVEFLPCAP